MVELITTINGGPLSIVVHSNKPGGPPTKVETACFSPLTRKYHTVKPVLRGHSRDQKKCGFLRQVVSKHRWITVKNALKVSWNSGLLRQVVFKHCSWWISQRRINHIQIDNADEFGNFQVILEGCDFFSSKLQYMAINYWQSCSMIMINTGQKSHYPPSNHHASHF